ncbi:MAG: Gfo/Idh/MocA family oxidoreductase [Deltaproteobacteria bacterium]|nr:Gfo/Idh/MocA family oxidoreductase [Deltaproteobacteria bacterium]
MSQKIKWGVLSTAKIGLDLVVPAMQQCKFAEITAIASRTLDSANAAAQTLNIPMTFGSYDALLSSPEVDAIYIPVPNHMHSEWAIKAMQAGKHVLCEKPLALSITDIKKMIVARDAANVKAGEAFMVNSHPQWSKVRQMLQDGAVGKIQAIQGFFSYINKDPDNIRNIAAYGGGALWDIGCYQIHCTRYLLGKEPGSIMAQVRFDPNFKTDYLAGAIMNFDDVMASFMVSTQTMHSQRLSVYGEKAKLEIEIPFNAPTDAETTVVLGRESVLKQDGETIRLPIINQYTAQGDEFSKAILDDTEVPVPFEDSLHNTAAILATFESARTGKSIKPSDLI